MLAIVSGAPTSAISPNRHGHRAERHQQRHEPQRPAEHEREHGGHHDQRDDEQAQRRGGQRVGEVLDDDGRAGDRVAAGVAQAPLRHRHRVADQLDRAAALGVAQPRLEPDLDRRRVLAREQVGEARLRRRGAVRRVEHERRDEVRVVDPRLRRQAEPVLDVELEQVADGLGVDELLRGLRVAVLLRLGEAPALRELARRVGRALRLGGLRLQPRLQLVLDLPHRRVDERAGAVDDLHGLRRGEPAARRARRRRARSCPWACCPTGSPRGRSAGRGSRSARAATAPRGRGR